MVGVMRSSACGCGASTLLKALPLQEELFLGLTTLTCFAEAEAATGIPAVAGVTRLRMEAGLAGGDTFGEEASEEAAAKVGFCDTVNASLAAASAAAVGEAPLGKVWSSKDSSLILNALAAA